MKINGYYLNNQAKPITNENEIKIFVSFNRFHKIYEYSKKIKECSL